MNAALGEQRADGGGSCVWLRLEPTGGGILEQDLDGLGRVLLVRADHSGRAALDPARTVDPLRDASGVVGDRAARSVEAHARQLDAPVADTTEDEAARERLLFFRRHRAVVPVELVA